MNVELSGISAYVYFVLRLRLVLNLLQARIRNVMRTFESASSGLRRFSNLYKRYHHQANVFHQVAHYVQRSMPQNTKPKPILPSIPQSALDIPNSDPPSEMQGEPAQNMSIISTDSLLTSPFDSPSESIAWPIPTLASPLLPTATKSTAIASGAFLENSKARHEAMSEQLVQMALQLRKNAQTFSEKLVEDKSIVEETQMKLDSNFGVMQKERERLRDHKGKSGSTTCLVIFAVVAVTITFVFMVALLRLTRR